MATRTKRNTTTAPAAATTEAAPEKIEGKEKRSMSDTLKQYRAGYKNGRRNGDTLSEMLVPVTPEEMPALAEGLLNFEPGELATKYGHLNRGQIRMNCGNRIRAAVKRGDLTEAEVLTAIGDRS